MFMRPYRDRTSMEREMRRLSREMNRFLSDWPTLSGMVNPPGYPAMNVWATGDNVVVTAELPGVKSEDIEVSVENDMLFLRGKRQPDSPEDGATYHRRERRFGSFNRGLRLPMRVEAGKVEATFKNGLLNITLPRAEADKPRKIALKSA